MKLVILGLWIALGVSSQAQSIPSYSADDLLARTKNEDTVYVINFWATWCGPCVKELPEFNELQNHFTGKAVKILMVSMDFKDAYPKKIESFVKKKKLLPEVVWLNETDANSFIPKLEERWQGSIPATLILYGKNSYRNFFEGEIKAEQLALLIDKQLAY